MSTSKVDSRKRIVLPDGRPGGVIDIQQQAKGRLLLIGLEQPEPVERMNRHEAVNPRRP